MKLGQADACGKYAIWMKIHLWWKKSLQPNLISEAFRFMTLFCSGSGSTTSEGHNSCPCGRNPVSKKLPLQSTSVFWRLWVLDRSFQLLFSAISFVYLLMRRVLISEYGEMLGWMWGSAQPGCMDCCSGIFLVWGMNLQCNCETSGFIFCAQFGVIRGSPSQICSSYYIPLFSFPNFRLEIPSCAVSSFNFSLLLPYFPLTACVVLNFQFLFKK